MHTPHGVIDTPAFMPVGTRASVKAMNQEQLEQIGAEIILGNTYHLYLRPGHDLIREMGGLHPFMSWPHPILTDSGGFQVFSLSSMTKVEEEGVTFRSHLDGSLHQFTPEHSIDVQLALGADIIMAFDECTAWPATEARTRESMELTLRWAERSRRQWQQAEQGYAVLRGDTVPYHQALFGIVQGGMYPALRRECAQRLIAMDFPGYALGGLSVGEPRPLTYEVVESVIDDLPQDKPRYVMGVGTPEELVEYVGLGVDMMDCVMPTRNARNGLLFTSQGRVSIKNAKWAKDPRPVDEQCGCAVCARYSRAYLRHLFQTQEILASCLNTWHNLYHYLDTMRRVRHAIALGQFQTLRAEIRARNAGRAAAATE
jgi:queuine tRNA-ribosyltransferase